MRWFIPFNKTSSRQRQMITDIINNNNKTYWIEGFAGSGKTIVMTHAMVKLAADNPSATLCFITFTHALKDMVFSGLRGSGVERIHVKTHTLFLSDKVAYDFVFIDEVQDIKPSDLNRIKALAKKVVLAGDADQKIYEGSSSEDEIVNTFKPIRKRLIEVFRLTERLRKLALSIFPSSRLVEGEIAANHNNATILLANFNSKRKEYEWVWNEAISRAAALEPSAILLSTHDAIYDFAKEVSAIEDADQPPKPEWVKGMRSYEGFNAYFDGIGLPLNYLGSGFGSFAASDVRPMVYLMTFHSAKGLDFENVFIPNLRSDTVIVSKKQLAQSPNIDKRLFFVATTRSRKDLFISYSGDQPHYLLSELPKDDQVITRVLNPKSISPADSEDEF